ncbi:hypothetical protein [Aliikangiella sp. G2MR2-5]|uniref:hypothetical protein n=1 Tax=Aliikangiella sp. G2MR2-5 TaxID=2788943 RepID=UPI0018AB7000|nr:hypothetical protein [Aliikangiella sp. G2MR2-5]
MVQNEIRFNEEVALYQVFRCGFLFDFEYLEILLKENVFVCPVIREEKMKLLYIVLSGLFINVLAGCVSSPKLTLDDTYLLAHKQINGNNKKSGIKNLHYCAEKGHGGCAEILGWEYYDGEYLKTDVDAAVYWLKVAAATELKFGYAGFSGALSVAEILCDEALAVSEDEIARWIEYASNLLTDARLSFLQEGDSEVVEEILLRIEVIASKNKKHQCKLAEK